MLRYAAGEEHEWWKPPAEAMCRVAYGVAVHTAPHRKEVAQLTYRIDFHMEVSDRSTSASILTCHAQPRTAAEGLMLQSHQQKLVMHPNSWPHQC